MLNCLLYLQIDCIALVPHMRRVIDLRSDGINCVNKSVDTEGCEWQSCHIYSYFFPTDAVTPCNTNACNEGYMEELAWVGKCVHLFRSFTASRPFQEKNGFCDFSTLNTSHFVYLDS